jgi:hypothetical protein
MAGTADGQKFGNTLDYSQDKGFDYIHTIIYYFFI